MSAPPHQGPKLRYWGIFALVLLAMVGAMFLATRYRPKLPAPNLEVHRQKLELRAAIWYAPDGTNKFTGFLLDTYEDGALKSRSAISNGLLEGLSQGWWSNNVLQVTEYYSNGISQGERTKYYGDGRTQSVVTVVNGKLEGRYVRWHENGNLAEEVNLKNGEPDGESIAYHPDGSLKARVLLEHGKILTQKFWSPGESNQSATTPVSEPHN